MLALASGVFASQVLSAQSSPPVLSASEQFSVQVDPRLEAQYRPLSFSDVDLVHLNSSLLIVSAERLRQHLERELDDTLPWAGRISFLLRPAESAEAVIQVRAEWSSTGWRYQVSMPDQLRADRFIRALVEINLLEMANRRSSGKSAEIPAWLIEGFTGHLIASRAIELILPPPRRDIRGIAITPWVVEELHYQPLAQAHAQLQMSTPLSIEELSWPTADSLNDRDENVYRHCSQLLVTRLLSLPNGQAMLRDFLSRLTQHYNWQVAFLEAFDSQFFTLLEFEKWWALQVVHFTGRDLRATYTYTDSVLRLQQVVHFPVAVRLSTNDLPMLSEVRLQTVIREWGIRKQTEALKRTLAELALLRARVAPELIELVDGYRLALADYLRDRDRSGLYLPKGLNQQSAMITTVRFAVRKLDRLDAQLLALLPEQGEDERVETALQ